MPDLRECIGNDDRRATLLALRDYLIRALAPHPDVELPPASAVASIAARLVEVLRELDSLPTGEEASTLDDLSARRASRRSEAAASKRPAGG